MKLDFIKKYLILNWLVFCLVTFCNAQHSLTLKKGEVVDSLLVLDMDTKYSIYLPKAFDLTKKWPILIGFDSKENTRKITQLYMQAAEDCGYVVAISDFPKNLDHKEKAEYVSTFMNYMFSLFPIQKGRVYTTGIADDAKLISLISVLSKDIFGVIAIGDSYYYNSSLKIEKNFSYVGILNTNNYRYKNFLKNKRYLNRKAVPAVIYTYKGESEFPSPSLLKKTLSSFTLQAINKGRIPKDSIWIKNQFEEELRQVDVTLAQRKFLYAYEELKRIQGKYKLFFDTSHLKEKEKQIRQLKGYKREKRLQSKYANRESILRQTYMFSIEEDVKGEQYENLGWWQYQMSELDTLLLSKEKYAHAMVHRVKGFLQNNIDNFKVTQITKKDNFEKRMFLNILSTIVNKKDFESYRMIISLSAQDQDHETALFYLEKLLKNDFKDIEALYNIEGTLALKISKGYNKMVKKYLGKSKYFFSE